MLSLIEQHRPRIAEMCRRFRVRRLDLFGSAARGTFRPERSDLDFLVEFENLGWQGSSDRYFGLLFGLEDLFARKIDLVELSAARNPHFIASATRHRETVYDARSPQAA